MATLPKIKFTVATNSNSYFASSLKSAITFCTKHDFVLWRDTSISLTKKELEAEGIEKVDRGIWYKRE